MIQAPESVLKEWKYLEDNHINCPDTFWKHWDNNWKPCFIDFQSFVLNNIEHEMKGDNLKKFYSFFMQLAMFLQQLRTKEYDFVLDKVIRNLIIHYVGNGLNNISYISETSQNSTEPISVDSLLKINTYLQDISEFWLQLRKEK